MKYFLIITFCFLIYKIPAQIVYHEFNPPIEIYVDEMSGNTSEYLYLDLNDDEINDLHFILKYWYSAWTPSYDEGFSSKLYTQHQFCVQNEMCTVVPLVEGDTIWTSLNWNNPNGNGKLMYADGLFCNNFHDFKYIGLKLLLDNNYFYGWINVSTYYHLNGYEPGSYAKLLVSDYAINSESDHGLIAGDTVNSLNLNSIVKSHKNSYFTLYPNPATKEIFIVSKNEKTIKEVNIYNQVGQRLIHKNQSTNMIDISSLMQGVYVIELVTSNMKVKEKLIIR